VFGTILNATVRAEIPRRLGIAPDDAAGLIREPAEIEGLPPRGRAAVVDSLALGVGRIYLVCAVVMAIGFVACVLLPERPLRPRAGISDALEEQAATVA
jgi:hypothetical protein